MPDHDQRQALAELVGNAQHCTKACGHHEIGERNIVHQAEQHGSGNNRRPGASVLQQPALNSPAKQQLFPDTRQQRQRPKYRPAITGGKVIERLHLAAQVTGKSQGTRDNNTSTRYVPTASTVPNNTTSTAFRPSRSSGISNSQTANRPRKPIPP